MYSSYIKKSATMKREVNRLKNNYCIRSSPLLRTKVKKVATSLLTGLNHRYHLPVESGGTEEDTNIVLIKKYLVSFIEQNLKCKLYLSSVSIQTETIGIVTLLFVSVIVKKNHSYVILSYNKRVEKHILEIDKQNIGISDIIRNPAVLDFAINNIFILSQLQIGGECQSSMNICGMLQMKNPCYLRT